MPEWSGYDSAAAIHQMIADREADRRRQQEQAAADAAASAQAAAERERVQRAKERVDRRLREIDAEIRRAAVQKRIDAGIAECQQRRRATERQMLAEDKAWCRAAVVCSTPTPLRDLRLMLRHATEVNGEVLGNSVDVTRWVDHATAWARAHHIEWRQTALPTTNAYASAAGAFIETAPIRSEESCVVFWHECGHLMHPCESSHTRVAIGTGTRTVCVACELQAWRFAARESPMWTRFAHEELAARLGSYRPHGTPSEQHDIDHLCSRLGFCEIRQARLQL